MKKILLLFAFIGSIANAQYSVKGSMHPVKKYSWVLLYKVEGARQIFVKNTQIKKEVRQKDGKNITVGTFEFELPADAKTGSYRITYDLQQNGFVDFLFNKENVEFSFDPNQLETSTVFSESKENRLYANFINDISYAQYKIDSLQVAYLKYPNQANQNAYKKAISSLNSIQNSYTKESQGTLVHHFIKATDRYNSPEVAKSSKEYLEGVVNHFYDKIDFSSEYLYNSSFLIDRVTDYVFYMNYSKDPKEQESLHKKAVDVSISKVNDVKFKSDVIQFLISQFKLVRNANLVEYLLKNHFEKLPKEHQPEDFRKQIDEFLGIAIGRPAPDFSWIENGKEMRLSNLTDGKSYLLIFYSTECSHCLREVPKVFDFMKGKNNTKVIAFAMETSDETWRNYQKNFPGWHHVLGLGKWENKTARTYQINSTPTYFVLGSDKKIIANPDQLEDVKKVLTTLNN